MRSNLYLSGPWLHPRGAHVYIRAVKFISKVHMYKKRRSRAQPNRLHGTPKKGDEQQNKSRVLHLGGNVHVHVAMHEEDSGEDPLLEISFLFSWSLQNTGGGGALF